ncbi:ParB N-terminal domain-containing protein [Oxalobacter sp. OttesenSCG-928-P03]|nr:ParB N-terminal domain-containing protein [Oxalobacter sp. OttesenSCG-928-P03]
MKIEEIVAELRDIDSLIPYPQNAKIHTDDQVDGIVAAIRSAGKWTNPIIVDQEGVIIAGHGRRLAAMKMGLKKVPVVVEKDMTAAQVRAARLNDNRAAIGNIDHDIFKFELMELGDDVALLEGVFDKKELDFAVVDVFDMNEDVFVTDIDSVMEEQRSHTDTMIHASAEKQVSIARAMGFKSVSGSDQFYVSRFMARLEADTGLQGEKAFMAFVKKMIEER